MSDVILVRHGQAQTGAQDEESYDKLSALGEDQARWLGEYFSGVAHGVERIVSGTMRRQRQTASHIAASLGLEVREDPRLNEINYFALAHSMKERHALELPTDRASFLEHLPLVMRAWKEDHIHNPDEDFAVYERRVLSALDDAEKQNGTMLVTSGGIIAMAVRHVLGLDDNIEAFSHVLLQTNNTSVHRYQVELGRRRLVTLNATPHLDISGREGTRTFI